LEAAEAAASEVIEQRDVLELLAQLVNQSLIGVERQPGTEARYAMLETIREFAREKLRAAHAEPQARLAHFKFYCNLVRRAQVFGPEKQVWLDRLETELGNIRAALALAIEVDIVGQLPPAVERAEEAMRMFISLADFYFYRGYTTEAVDWVNRLLAVAPPPSQAHALALQKAGFLTRVSGDYEKAIGLLKRARAMAEAVGDKERAGWALLDMGHAARDLGQMDEVIPDFEAGLRLFEELKSNRGIENSFYQLAETYMVAGDLEQAQSFWEKGLALARTEADRSYIAWGLEGLGEVAFFNKQWTQAGNLHQESLRYKVEVMDKGGIAHSFEGLAQVAAASEEPERAATLWGAADSLRQALNNPLDPSRSQMYTSLIPTVIEQLGEAAFAIAWSRGQALSLSEAVAVALGEAD
jgi:non-specific serine/threonine protein kinase